VLGVTVSPSLARADLADPSPSGKSLTPEEDDFTGSPYTNYGEFNNQEAEEEADELFFQYGRFFGLSLGLGYEPVTGNRGLLYTGGFPTIEFKLHYWFDFNFALNIDVYSASHSFLNPNPAIGHTDVNIVHLGLELKYYFDTKDLSSTISFANPYIIGGVGPYTKTQTSAGVATPDTDTSIGLDVGAGLEFAVSPKKVYIEFEGRLHIVQFKDQFDTEFSAPNAGGIPDLTGQLVTLTGAILFTF
jgi:opacity protein-like surface antigen